MKLIRPLALTAVLALAACTSSPTDSASHDPAAPSFNGGMFGSGTFSTEDGGGSLGSGNYSGDGGLGMGSGNYTGEPSGPGMVGSGNYTGDGVSSDSTTAGGTETTRGTNLIGSGT